MANAYLLSVLQRDGVGGFLPLYNVVVAADSQGAAESKISLDPMVDNVSTVASVDLTTPSVKIIASNGAIVDFWSI